MMPVGERQQWRVALVTGANRGIGSFVSLRLAQMGWFVFVGCRNQVEGERVVAQIVSAGGDAKALLIDVTDDASVNGAAATIGMMTGRLDVLINNAGILREGDFTDPTRSVQQIFDKPSAVTMSRVRETFEVNTFGAIAVTNAMLPLLRKANSARVINVSSALASLTRASYFTTHEMKDDYLNLLAYNSSKAALNAATLQFALELKSSAITVNAVDPGHCATDINGNIGDRQPADAARIIVKLATSQGETRNGCFFNELGVVPW